ATRWRCCNEPWYGPSNSQEKSDERKPYRPAACPRRRARQGDRQRAVCRRLQPARTGLRRDRGCFDRTGTCARTRHRSRAS
ncbi:hypothetical protein C1X54_38930, partial [Pseudomonas sp. GW460-13]